MTTRHAFWALLAIAVLPLLSWAAEPVPGDAVLGQWWFPKKNGKMEIRREKDKYFGKVVDYDDPDALDEHNPDPNLQTRPFIGIEMLADFNYDPQEKKWIDGTIYDGESGKTYKCSMWFENGDASRMNVRGYIGFSFLGRTEVFTRVTSKDEQSDKKPEPAD
jgi:uncharacterized protein (DUF2147 family)